MDHIKNHVGEANENEGHKTLCRYCLKMFATDAILEEHLTSSHPLQTRDGRGAFKCIICAVNNTITKCLFLFLFICYI